VGLEGGDLHRVGFFDGGAAENEALEEGLHDGQARAEDADADFDDGPCPDAILSPYRSVRL